MYARRCCCNIDIFRPAMFTWPLTPIITLRGTGRKRRGGLVQHRFPPVASGAKARSRDVFWYRLFSQMQCGSSYAVVADEVSLKCGEVHEEINMSKGRTDVTTNERTLATNRISHCRTSWLKITEYLHYSNMNDAEEQCLTQTHIHISYISPWMGYLQQQ